MTFEPGVDDLGLANGAYFLPDTVITGFKTGAAIYIASTQLPKLFGIDGVPGSFFDRIADVATSLPQAHMPSLIVGVGAIVLFLVLERTLPGRPATLLVVAAAIVATNFSVSTGLASTSSARCPRACRRSDCR